MPRIELLGAVASVRLAETIRQSVKIEFGNRYFFTDSSAVFGMITGESGSFMEFVGTRTGEIKSKSERHLHALTIHQSIDLVGPLSAGLLS